MDEKKNLVAVASSDGIVVNQHFGRAGTFFIYEVSETEIKQQEVREVTPVCMGGNHEEERLKKNVEKISDCRYLLVSRIGNQAAHIAEGYGIQSFEIPGMIPESIDQMMKYKKIQELLKEKGN